MKFESGSVKNCYILGDEVFENQFFTYINAKAIYSATIFHLAFFKGDVNLVDKDRLKEYQKFSNDLYRLNSPNLYIPFEVDFHENFLYQAYYESDHFPLSVWIEEKSLIPFNIFIQVMEDTLFGLKALETAGHSHLLLTPEEVLVPLQWNVNKHVKLDNVGLNSIIHSFLNNTEIDTYRKNYYQKKNKSVENKLVKNISEDLYSFGKIINQIIPLCVFDSENNKKIIQNKINQIINKPDSISSFEKAIELFVDYFKTKRPHILPDKAIDFKYTGQASFDIPNYDNWHEEAVLEPFTEEVEIVSTNEIVNNINPVNNEKKSFIKSVSSLFLKFFPFGKKKKIISKTLNDYRNQLKNPKDSLPSSDTQKKEIAQEKASSPIGTNTEDSTIRSKNTDKILEEIEDHYQNIEKNIISNIEVSHTKSANSISYEQNSYQDKTIEKPSTSKKRNPLTKNIDSLNDKNIFIEFNKSLIERDYGRSFNIIKKSVSGNLNLKPKKSINNLEQILNDKLKQLDDHYIVDNDINIIAKLIKLDSILPMKITEQNTKAVSDLKNKLEQELTSFPSYSKGSNKNINIFLRFLNYLKSQYRKLFTK